MVYAELIWIYKRMFYLMRRRKRFKEKRLIHTFDPQSHIRGKEIKNHQFFILVQLDARAVQ